MKKFFFLFAAAILAVGTISSRAQMGGAPAAPQFNGAMKQLFGENQTFSATMEMQMDNGGSQMTMSGKISFDKGDSRFEMDMSQMHGGNLPPAALAQMKAMGLDRVISISQEDKKAMYLIYPGLQAYAQIAVPAPDAVATNDAKVDVTELGAETVDGHPCIKNKAIVTDENGTKHEFTVWNATDLKKFPIKIQINEGQPVTLAYNDITFSKPDANLFVPPSGYTKYNSVQEMMQSVMMKQMGGAGMPPRQ